MATDVATELYRELHDHVRDIILVIHADTGQIVEANRAATHAYQYTRGELLVLAIYDLRVEPPPSVSEQMRTADREGSLFETVHRRKDGSVFPVEVSSRGETLGETRYLLSIIRDITERKRAQEAHQRAELERERLLSTTQHALATREEFLWVASHELRTPITIVSLQLHQLRRAIDRGDPVERLTASAEAALAHVDRLSALVQRLLDASQLDNGPRLDLGDVLLADVARNALERVRSQTDAAGIDITIEIPPVTGRWDAVRLEQVLINLLSNAVKYGLRQPVAVTARLDLDVVHIEVRDHGIGLPASETDRIFGKFERAVSTAHYGGLGLGLYIARQIVEAHRGWIDVESAPGRGSTFRVTLPLREDRRGPLRISPK
jgi:PAS domain S-box-containing protein